MVKSKTLQLVPSKMLRTQVYVFLSFCAVATVLLRPTTALPSCAPNDEDCRDRRMHPSFDDSSDHLKRKLSGEDTNAYWIDQGKKFVQEKLHTAQNKKRAKNVIMFLGDGMGLTTTAATRNVLGGEEKALSFEHFPYTGLSKTYSVDKIVPDSACTATAYLCGVKAQQGTIGLSGNVARDDCLGMQDSKNHVKSIAQWAMEAGKWAGVVTTTRITHASPAGVYAHVAERDWEDDTEVITDCGPATGARDIAQQLIHGETGSKLKFIMGGGRKHFKSARTDGRDLIDEFKKLNPRNLYLETHSELNENKVMQAERVLGLFQNSHLLYHLETNATTDQPTLEDMTVKAIEFMRRSEEGYFLFIEGGRIDMAHHDNMARIALDETVEFSKAIQAARDMTDEEDTLIVVTADHSHAFSYSGYAYRGADVFGRTRATPDDKTPFTVLNYANGPSYEHFYDVKQNKRRNPLDVVTGSAHDMFPATWPLDLETHGGDDVGVFASGPWAHLFSGVYEQNTIPHMMAYAACLGNGLKLKACDN